MLSLIHIFMALPVLLVSAYVFGLKQGKPSSYDVELAEWLIIKMAGVNYFSPSKVPPPKVPFLENIKTKTTKGEVPAKAITDAPAH